MKSIWKSITKWYVHLIDRQGFPIAIVICVAVITATALWTDRHETPYIAPTPPVSGDISAAQLIQQSLQDASVPTPLPSPAPPQFAQPLAEYELLRPFSMSCMVQSGVTGIWAIHDAVDLSAPFGAKVFAIADGVIDCISSDKLQGVWIRIDHGDGIMALYSGMSLKGAFIEGDPVHQGDPIGYVGNGPLGETNLTPHLHLRVTKDSQAIDPVSLWKNAP